MLYISFHQTGFTKWMGKECGNINARKNKTCLIFVSWKSAAGKQTREESMQVCVSIYDGHLAWRNQQHGFNYDALPMFN